MRPKKIFQQYQMLLDKLCIGPTSLQGTQWLLFMLLMISDGQGQWIIQIENLLAYPISQFSTDLEKKINFNLIWEILCWVVYYRASISKTKAIIVKSCQEMTVAAFKWGSISSMGHRSMLGRSMLGRNRETNCVQIILLTSL